MSWIQVVVNTTSKQAVIIDKLFNDMGALSITFQDSADTPIFDPPPPATDPILWSKTQVTALFSTDGLDVEQFKKKLLQSSRFLSDIICRVEVVEDRCWQREWMRAFRPLKFGEKLWVSPSWQTVNDETAINVILDPGLAFGTGNHATTALCLTWLEALTLEGKTIIDYGCGSGILAIAALKLGAAEAIAVDIDQQALSATLENAKKNQVNDRLKVYRPEDLPSIQKADVMLANILASTLKSVVKNIEQHVKSNGLLALSGILTSQYQDLISTYQPYFILEEVVSLDEWCLISAKKR